MSTTFVHGERPRPDWLRRNPRAWLAAVGTVCFGAFMGQLDASIVALTYHSIGHSFHAGLDQVQWISQTYLIALALLLVPIGRLSDRLGRKRVYLWGFGAFTASSLGCALAPSLGALVGLRAVQGAGAAMLQANSVAIVSTSAPNGRMRAALGIQAAAQSIGLAAGPTLGGIVVQLIGWRWVFAINVPIGVVAMVAGRYLLPRTRIPAERPPRSSLGEVFHGTRVRRNLLGALVAYLTLFGPIVLVPQLLQNHGHTAFVAGLVVATLPVGFAAGAVVAERLLPAHWDSDQRGLLGATLSLLALAGLIVSQTAIGPDVVLLVALGIGLGVYIPANNAVIMSAVSARVAAVTGGLVNTGRALGTAAGTAVVAELLTVGNGRIAAAALLVISLAIPGVVVSGRRARPPAG